MMAMEPMHIALIVIGVVYGVALVFLFGQFKANRQHQQQHPSSSSSLHAGGGGVADLSNLSVNMRTILDQSDRIRRGHVALIERVARDGFDSKCRNDELARALIEMDGNLQMMHDYCVSLGTQQQHILCILQTVTPQHFEPDIDFPTVSLAASPSQSVTLSIVPPSSPSSPLPSPLSQCQAVQPSSSP